MTDETWFDPRRFYEGGYPCGFQSSLSHSPHIIKQARRLVKKLGPTTGLEVGPGTCPVLGQVLDDVVLVDLARPFLKQLKGFRVQADILALPFRERFDVVAALDVLPHVPVGSRETALRRLVEAGRALLLYGCQYKSGESRSPVDEVPEAFVDQRWIRETLLCYGFDFHHKTWTESLPRGPYERVLTVAWRPDDVEGPSRPVPRLR